MKKRTNKRVIVLNPYPPPSTITSPISALAVPQPQRNEELMPRRRGRVFWRDDHQTRKQAVRGQVPRIPCTAAGSDSAVDCHRRTEAQVSSRGRLPVRRSIGKNGDNCTAIPPELRKIGWLTRIGRLAYTPLIAEPRGDKSRALQWFVIFL